MRNIKVTDGMFEDVRRFFKHNYTPFSPMTENNEDYVDVIETILEEGMRMMVREHGFKFPSLDERE